MKLNDSKTEIMIVGGMNQSIRADNFGNSVVHGINLVLMDFVRNSGVIFDKYLNFVKHITLLVRDCNNHTRNVGAVSGYLDKREW